MKKNWMFRCLLVLSLSLSVSLMAACGDEEEGETSNNSTGNNGQNNNPNNTGNNNPNNTGNNAQNNNPNNTGNNTQNNNPNNTGNNAQNNNSGPGSLVAVAADAGDFSILLEAATEAGLADTLASPDVEFTIFAPTDAAFARLLEDLGITKEELLASENLLGILTYHAVPGKVSSSEVVGLTSATTVSELPVFISTVGDSVYINASPVSATDIEASNGIIHVIDEVLLPPVSNLVGTAVAIPDEFTQLEGAVTDAGLVEALSGEGPLTVFAPIDMAFEALMEVPTGDALVDVLTYHVVEGAVYSHSLSDGLTVPTLNGAEVTFTLTAEGAMINDANILDVDITTTNGVIHVIDKVIVPPSE